MLSGLYPTPTQCNRNSLLDFIELWTIVQMSDSSLCLSPLVSKKGDMGHFQWLHCHWVRLLQGMLVFSMGIA